MQSVSKETQERIEQFERMGGVDLRKLDPLESHDLLAEVRTGIAFFNKAVFEFECLLCGRVERNNQDMEPLCTGPSWTDDHVPEVMVRLDATTGKRTEDYERKDLGGNLWS